MGIYYGKADFINYGKPSLLLDFANKKSLTDRISGNNLFTFTRTSTGTYVGSDGLIKSAAVNEARFDHNPVTGESLGLLIEESRTNSVTTSNVITSSLISAYGTALNLISSGVPPSPKGENIYEIPSSAEYRIIGTNGNSFGGNSGASTTWTYSIFVYPLSGISSVNLNNHFGGATTYNLNTLTITSTGGYTGTIQRFSNGWWRLSYTRTYSTSTELGLTIPGNPGYYFSSAQIEQGAFPTSYIPTAGSQVTRTADSASITGGVTSFYNQNQGTINLEFNIPPSVDTNNNRINYLPLVCLDDNTTNNSLELGIEGSNPSVVTYASGLMRDAIIPKQNLIGTSKSVGSYTATGGYVSQSSLSSVNGDNDAFLFIDDNTNASYHLIGTSISSPGFQTNFVHVVSVYAKKYNSDFVFLQTCDGGNRSANAVFNFANPGAATQVVMGTFGSNYSTGMIDCGGGWYRLYIVFIIGSSAPVTLVRFGPAPAATGNTIWGPGLTYTSSGLGVYFSNPQIEKSCIIGKYISTTSGSVTDADYYNSITKNKILKMGYTYNNSTNKISFSLDGKPISSLTQTSTMSYNKLRIGSNSANTLSNAIIKKISYYPSQLTETQLESLTR